MKCIFKLVFPGYLKYPGFPINICFFQNSTGRSMIQFLLLRLEMHIAEPLFSFEILISKKKSIEENTKKSFRLHSSSNTMVSNIKNALNILISRNQF